MRRALGLLLVLAGCQQIFGLESPVGSDADVANPCPPRDIATGRSHTCVVDTAGAVWHAVALS